MTTSVQVRAPVAPALREAAGSRSGVARKIVAIGVMLVGAALIALTLIVNLFSVGPAFERLTDGFRPVLTQQAITSDRQYIDGLAAAGSEIQSKLLPGFAQQMGMTPQQMTSLTQ